MADSQFIFDVDGLSNDALLSQSAHHMFPRDPDPIPPAPKEPTVEERLKTMEEKMAGNTDSWSNSEWWNRDTSPAPAPEPSAAQPQAQVPVELPKTGEDFQRAVQQGVIGVLQQVGQQNTDFQNRVGQMRGKFLANKDYAPWYPVAEAYFTDLVQQGITLDQAGQRTIDHVRRLHTMGAKPPSSSSSMGIPSPNAGYGFQPQNGQYRPDENPGNRISFYTEEQRVADRDVWLDRQRKAHEYAKTKGAFGEPLISSNPDMQK